MKWTMEQVLDRIEELSEEGVAPSTSEHPELRRVALELFGSWSEACDIVGVETRDAARSYSDEEILEDLRSRSEDGVAPSASDDGNFYKLVYDRFGSWKDACREAGVTPVSEAEQDRIDQWKTRDDIRQALRTRSDGEYAPNSQEHNVLMKAVLKLYDTWTDAVEDVGLKLYEEKSRQEGYDQKVSPTDWTREKIVERIREVSEEGEAPSTREHEALSKAAKDYFDSWRDACHEAGVITALEAMKLDRDTLIERLQEASTNGVAPSSNDFQHYRPALKEFGPWEAACEAAGVRPIPKRTWTRERIKERLKEDATDGVAPSSKDAPYTGTAVKRFGSWQSAYEAVGLMSRSDLLGRDPEKYQDWDRASLIEHMQEEAEDGVAPPARMASYRHVAERIFESWVEACEAAGLEREDNRQKWTRKKMIERLRDDATDGVAPDTNKIGYANTVIRLFGSWENGCEAAGLEPKGHTKS